MGKKKNKDELTTKQKLFCRKAILQYKGNISQAYADVYNTKHPAHIRANASHLIDRENIKNYMKALLIESGLAPSDLSNKLLQLTNAEKFISHNKKLVPIPDNQVQMSAVKTALDIYGVTNDVKSQSLTDARSVTVNISSEDVTKLDKISQVLAELNRKLELGDGQSGEVE